MTTFAVAVYGAVVATFSLILAILSYRAGGTRVTVSANQITEAGRVVGIRVEARNSGRSGATLDLIQLEALPSDYNPFADREIGPVGIPASGPGLPFRLDGHAACEWVLGDQEVRDYLWHHEGRMLVVAAKVGGRKKAKVVVAGYPPSPRLEPPRQGVLPDLPQS
jgi:hypothetical protein